MTPPLSEVLKEYRRCVDEAEKSGGLSTAAHRIVEGDIEGLLRRLQRGVPGQMERRLDTFVAAKILSAALALGPALRLSDPVSGAELEAALAPFRNLAADLELETTSAFSDLQEAFRLSAELFKSQITSLVDQLQEMEDPAPNHPLASALKEYADTRRREMVEYQDMLHSSADASTSQMQLCVKELQASLVRDLQRVKDFDTSAIERKFRYIDALITQGPPLAGFLLDKWLETRGLPHIATQIGLAAGIADALLLRPHVDEAHKKQESTARSVAFFISATVILPAVTVQVANVRLTTFDLYLQTKQDLGPSPNQRPERSGWSVGKQVER